MVKKKQVCNEEFARREHPITHLLYIQASHIFSKRKYKLYIICAQEIIFIQFEQYGLVLSALFYC